MGDNKIAFGYLGDLFNDNPNSLFANIQEQNMKKKQDAEGFKGE